jgi:heme exporter protein CcmD
MLESLDFGRHASFVWGSIAIFLLLSICHVVWPWLAHRFLLQRLATRHRARRSIDKNNAENAHDPAT